MKAAPLLAAMRQLLFAVLLGACLFRAIITGAPLGWQLAGCVALAAWYLAGSLPRLLPRLDQRLWLLGLVLLWAGLVVVSPENVWLAFLLWLLAGLTLPTWPAVGLSVVVLAIVVLRPWLHAGSTSMAAVIGPAIGALFALTVAWGQRQLLRDARERTKLVDSLVRAQAESAALHDELALAQRESGKLAERTRLARDIHDTVAQGFSSVILLARAGARAEPAAVQALLAQIEAGAQSNLDEVRRVIQALAPSELADTGLAAALRTILDKLAGETGLDTELRIEPQQGALPAAYEVALLRVAQGALANVRQHAAASRVVLTLAETDDSVRLDIVDDGRGFDPAALAGAGPAVGGYGLRASRDRLRELGGGLDLESAPGDGTAVSAWLPLFDRRSER